MRVLLLQRRSDIVILFDIGSKRLLVCIPLGVPVADDSYSQTMRINFLSHIFLLMP